MSNRSATRGVGGSQVFDRRDERAADDVLHTLPLLLAAFVLVRVDFPPTQPSL